MKKKSLQSTKSLNESTPSIQAKVIAYKPDIAFEILTPQEIKEFLYNEALKQVSAFASSHVEEIEKTTQFLKNLAKKALENIQMNLEIQ